jgi:serine/threonine protein kinase
LAGDRFASICAHAAGHQRNFDVQSWNLLAPKGDAATMSTELQTSPKAFERLPEPQLIGKYRVLAKLGEGATSEVFLCRDDFAGRDVAVKLVRAAVVGDGLHSRYIERFFAAEAALVGRLQHPNVVQLYDAVADPVQPYLVMEYVAGSTLRPYCSPDQLLPLELIVELGFKCAMALGYVARQGVVHRDVKPANLLVEVTHGAIINVKISDFGSALNLGSDLTHIDRIGSLAYVSPEQLEGDMPDSRSDMYSLGAVLYHLIAGRAPLDAASPAAMMQQIFQQRPEPLGPLRQGVDPALDAVIQRALAKRPQDRHPDWDAFAQALAALVSNQLVPRGEGQSVLDSERFTLLRQLEFFAEFGDVDLWDVVHRAQWERFRVGQSLYRKGDAGKGFHIIARGEVEVFRNGEKVAQLGAGTSVGEMAYLAPSPALRQHSADVVVSKPTASVSFTPETLARLSPTTRHAFDQAFIRVLVRRLHAAHEAMAHPRRVL